METSRSARITAEHFTHRTLWLTAQHLHELGLSKEEGGFYPLLSAGLFAFLAFEAFLNELGHAIAPEIWRQERDFFRGREFRGTLGKLLYLAQHSGLSLKKGERPYQTIRMLAAQRHRLVHGRTERQDKVVRFSNAREIPSLRPAIDSFADEGFVGRALLDVEAMSDNLLAAAQQRHGKHVMLGSARAFVGMAGYQHGWIE
jgi:hypothetical protein